MNREPDRDGADADAAQVGRLLRLPAERELPGSRHRQLKEYLMREIAQSTTSESATTQPSTAPPATTQTATTQTPKICRSRRRLAYFAAPLAAAGTFAVFAVSANGSGGPAPHGGTAQNSTSQGTTTQPATPATVLLDKIAAVAQTKPLPSVRDDQFVYVESEVSSEVDTQSSSGYHSTLTPLHLRQIWNSVNDSRPGLLREQGQDTVLPVPTGTGVVVLRGILQI